MLVVWVNLIAHPGYASTQVVTQTNEARANSSLAADEPTTNPQSSKTENAVQVRASEAYGKLPLTFEANQGQSDSRVRFRARGNGYNLFLTQTEALLALDNSARPANRISSPAESATLQQDKKNNTAVVRMKLVGANQQAKVVGLDETASRSNYFIGNNPDKWKTGIVNYQKVKYESVYPAWL